MWPKPAESTNLTNKISRKREGTSGYPGVPSAPIPSESVGHNIFQQIHRHGYINGTKLG